MGTGEAEQNRADSLGLPVKQSTLSSEHRDKAESPRGRGAVRKNRTLGHDTAAHSPTEWKRDKHH